MNVRNGWFLVLAGATSLGLVAAAACGGGTSRSDKTTTAAAGGGKTTATTGPAPSDAAPDSQQVVTFHNASEPNTIDPQGVAYDYELTIEQQLYLTLLDQDPQTGNLIPRAASEVPTQSNGGVSADGLTYTIKLKPGLKWSDGSPLTAEDFVYGILRGFNLNVSGSGYGGFITQINGTDAVSKLDAKSATYAQDIAAALRDSVVAVDPATIKFVLSGPSASFAYDLFLPITAATKQSNVEALGDSFGQAASAGQMVTSGPFKPSEWVPKDHLTIVRNDNYTADHLAYLKQVTDRFISDANQAFNAYQAGGGNGLDEVGQIPAAVYPSASKDPVLSKEIQQEPEFGVRWITVDVTIPPWNNKDFVIGMNQATDREAIGRDVYFGLRKPWHAPCPEGVVACDPTLFDNLDYNPDQAKASIARAYPNGGIPDVTLEVPEDPTTKALATTLQSQWQKVGVTANIVTTDQKTLRADMKAHKSGTQITGFSMDFADPTDLWSIRTTAQIGANNFGFYSRPAYDALEADQDATLDSESRNAKLRQLQQMLAADPSDIYFAIQLRTDFFKSYIKGISSSPYDWYRVGDQHLADVYVAKH